MKALEPMGMSAAPGHRASVRPRLRPSPCPMRQPGWRTASPRCRSSAGRGALDPERRRERRPGHAAAAQGEFYLGLLYQSLAAQASDPAARRPHLESAVLHYEGALAGPPRSGPTLNNLARVLGELGEFGRADAIIGRALALDDGKQASYLAHFAPTWRTGALRAPPTGSPLAGRIRGRTGRRGGAQKFVASRCRPGRRRSERRRNGCSTARRAVGRGIADARSCRSTRPDTRIIRRLIS